MTLLKGSLKVLVSYLSGVFLFTFFLIAPLSMENNMNTWIAIYSLVFFIFTVIFLYKQMQKTGEFESSHMKGKGSLLNGVAYALLGFLPFLVLEIVYFIVYPQISTLTGGNVLHGFFRCGFGPMYFIIRFLGYTWYAYLISSVVIPLVAFLGYSAGFTGKRISRIIIPRKKDEEDFLND